MDCMYCGHKMENLNVPTMDYLPEHVDLLYECPNCGARCSMTIYEDRVANPDQVVWYNATKPPIEPSKG